jgi:hypothetical protein
LQHNKENMETQSQNISAIAKALIKAQTEMSTPKKSSNNPFFKSKYADLNEVREACLPAFNENGISVWQPTITIDGKPFVKTVLLHESGEWIAGFTEIICNKVNDAQSHGSGVTYARRYGLQSMANLGSEDDDGNADSKPTPKQTETTGKVWLNPNTKPFDEAIAFIKKGGTIEQIKTKYSISKINEELLINQSK